MEPLFDPSSPIHALIVLGLAVGGLVSAWLGLRDGFLRREMKTSSGLYVGGKAMLAGALYIASGLLALWGGIAFFLRARG